MGRMPTSRLLVLQTEASRLRPTWDMCFAAKAAALLSEQWAGPEPLAMHFQLSITLGTSLGATQVRFAPPPCLALSLPAATNF